MFEFLHNSRCLTCDETIRSYWESRLWPDRLKEIASETQTRMEIRKQELTEEVQSAADDLLIDIDSVQVIPNVSVSSTACLVL